MKTISILLIEDNNSDVRLIREMLKEINHFKSILISAGTLKEGYEEKQKNSIDIVLLDLNLPDSTGVHTFQKVAECCQNVPIVLITGTEDEELSLKLIKEGAQDYLTKQNLNSALLGKSILYSIERQNLIRNIKLQNEQIKRIENERIFLAKFPSEDPGPILRIAENGKLLYINQAGIKLLPDWQLTKNEIIPSWLKKIIDPVFTVGTNIKFELSHRELFYSFYTTPIIDESYANLYGYEITERKQAEDALKISEEKYRLLAEKITDVIWLLDLNSKSLFVSKSIEKFTGYTVEEYLTQSITDRFTPESASLALNTLKNEIAYYTQLEVKPKDYQKRLVLDFVCKDGTIKTGELIVSPYFDEKNKPLGLHSIVRDITENKKMEEALIKSEMQFRELYQNAKIGLYRTTPDGTILMANKALVSMLGYPSFEKLAERNLEKDSFEPNYQRKVFINKIEKDGEIRDFESVWKRLDGTTFFVQENTQVIRNSDGVTMYYDGVVEDITERKLEEEKLLDSREDLNRLLNSIAEGAYGVDINGICNFVNRAFLKILGYQNDNEILGKHIHELIHHSHFDGSPYPSSECKMNSVHQTNQPINVTDEVLWSKEGIAIPVEYWSHPIVKDGVVIGSIATFIDITERKQTEKKLIASETRYRRLFESAKDGILILDAETGMIVDVNPFLIELLGFSKNEFKEKEIWEIGFLKDFVANKDKFLELQQQEYIRYDNLPFETASGRKINVEFVSNVYLVDKMKVIQCNIRDITERKRVENALITSKTHLRMLVQTIPDLIWTKDIDGKYLSCNAMFERFFGANEANIIGKTDYDFVDQELASFFRENDQMAMEAGKPTSNEEWITFADDGHRAYLETIKTPMFDDQNRLLGVLGIGRDITDRKNAEQKVKESEKRFRAIFSQAPIGIALIDVQGQLVIANLPLSKMVGYSCDELSKKKFADFTHPEDIDKDLEQFNDLINGKISMYTMEKRYVHKNGNLIWANLFVTILRDENGNFMEILGMAEDISERKRIEKEITMLAQSLRSVNECVSITDTENKILFVNESFLKTYGYELNELIGKPINIIRSQSNEQEFVNEIFSATIHGVWKGELLNRRKDGNEFPIYLSTSMIKDKDGKPLGLIGVATDITERKHAEETLMKLLTALEQTVDTLVITDRNGTIEYVNHAFEDITGYSSEEALGKTPRILKSGAKDLNYYEGLWKTILSGKVFRSEILNKKKNGDLYYVEKTISPIFDKNKNITHFVGTGTDITDRKHKEEELIEAKENAEESDRLKTAFLQNISHEIRTPMNGILGFAGLLKKPNLTGDKLHEYIEVIEESGMRMLNIINDIIEISKIETEQIVLHLQETNVNQMIKHLHTFFNVDAEKTGVVLTYNLELTDEQCIIETDETKLTQVLSNLLKNALKFIKSGTIDFGYHLKGQMLEFYVKDTGIGIVNKMQDSIFKRFRQVDMSHTRDFEGLGLGLSISKAFVEKLGGEIWVESELGKGSTFLFNIPYNLKIVKLLETSSEIRIGDRLNIVNILIAEDDFISRQLLKEMLESESTSLFFANNGKEAIDILETVPKIQIVLMDLKMPVMNGFEATKLIKKMNPDLPVIAQSAYAFSFEKKKAKMAGCDDFINKPIDQKMLFSIINKQLEKNKKM